MVTGIIPNYTSSSNFESLTDLGLQISRDVNTLGSKLNVSDGVWDLSNISPDEMPESFANLELKGVPRHYDDLPLVVYLSQQLTALYGDAENEYLGEVISRTTSPITTKPPVLAPPLCDGVVILDPANNPLIMLRDLGLPTDTPSSQIAFENGIRWVTPAAYGSEGYSNIWNTSFGWPDTSYFYFTASFVTRIGETDLSPTLAIGPIVSYNLITLSVVLPIPPEVISVRYYVFPRTIQRTTHTITVTDPEGNTHIIPVSNTTDTPTYLASVNSVLLPSESKLDLSDSELFIDVPFLVNSGSTVDQTIQAYTNYYLFAEVDV